jgi:hypothetical protein
MELILTEEGSEDKPENPRTNKRSHSEEKEADVANQKRDRRQSSKMSTLTGVPLGSRNDDTLIYVGTEYVAVQLEANPEEFKIVSETKLQKVKIDVNTALTTVMYSDIGRYNIIDIISYHYITFSRILIFFISFFIR